MFKKLFKNKPVGFYFSLTASLLSLFLTIFYTAYMGTHGLFNGGVFVFYLLSFLLPLIYFFVEENALTRLIPISQTVCLGLAVGISIPSMGTEIVYYLTGASNIASTTASGEILIFVIAATLVTALVSLVASFMRQTKPLTAVQQAEVDEDWASFKTNTKEFAVKHKTPLIISGAGLVAIIIILVLLFTLIIPNALTVHVGTVKFDQSAIVMYETETQRLVPTIGPEEAENKNITFASSNEEVATVSESGVVKALKVGETTITATAEDGDVSATCRIEVKELTVTETTIAKMPNTVHYLYGMNEEFDDGGISVVATLTNGKTEKITKGKHNLTFSADAKYMKEGEIIVSDATVPVTATYTYRGKTFTTSFDVYGDAAEADDAAEFNNALANGNIRYMFLTQDIELDSITVNRNLGIEGNIFASGISVAENATLTMEDGRIASDGNLEISGKGSIVATAYETSTTIQQDRREHAAIFAEGSLTIAETNVECSNIAANDFTVSDGADVTVFGKNVSIKTNANFGDYSALGLNGVHLGGGLIVKGSGTVLNVLYNDISFGSSPAAVETTGVTVDGATLNIGSNEGCSTWAYAVWASSGNNVTAVNGAKVTFEMTNDTPCIWGMSGLEVLDTSEFTMNATNYTNADLNARFDDTAKVTVNGTVFDMSKPLEERVFGDMTSTGEVSVFVDPDALYFAGDEFTGEGISVNAEFSGGSSSGKLRVALASGFDVERKTLVEGENTVTVKVGDETLTCTINARPAPDEGTAVATTAEAFAAALADDLIHTIIVNGDLGNVTVTRNITVEGNLNVDSLTVNNGVTLTMKDGRIFSDGALTIRGEGKIVATAFVASPETVREGHAAIYAGGKLTIDGTDVDCCNIATNGDIEIKGGATVNVYGKRAAGANGIHAPGATVTVSGSGTVLNVLYNDENYDINPANGNPMTPAAFEVKEVIVDDARLYVGNGENCASWAFGIWSGTSGSSVTARNGAYVRFDVSDVYDAGKLFEGIDKITVTGTDTRFIVVTPREEWQQSLVTGNAEWYETADEVPDAAPVLVSIKATSPAKVSYIEGETFDPTGMVINAVYSNGQETIVPLNEVTFSVAGRELTAADTTIKIRYGAFETTISITVSPASAAAIVTDESEFMTALGNSSITDITISGDFTIAGTVTLDRNIAIRGDLKVTSLTVNEGVTLTMADGRIVSDGNLEIKGTGKIIATAYVATNVDNRVDHAAIYAGGKLTIDGADVDCCNIATGNSGDIEIKGGAVVNVYGKNAIAGTDVVNGIHASGATITVSGTGTELNILYNAGDYAVNPANSSPATPAAIEAAEVIVDGARFNVGSNENCELWSFGIWNGGDGKITAKNGAYVKFELIEANSVFNGIDIYAQGDDTRFVIVTSEDNFQRDIVRTGLVEWYSAGQTVPDTKPEITGIKVVTAPGKLVYNEGDKFDPTGIVVKAVYGESGQESTDVLTDLTYSPDGALSADDTKITVSYGEYTAEIAITVKAADTSAEVDTAEALKQAFDNPSITNITIVGDVTLTESITIDQDISVWGNLTLSQLTVNEGAALTMVDGRISSTGDLTISGAGTIEAMNYNPSGASNRTDYVAIYAGGALTISGTTVECYYLYADGDITINEGAQVTVYGRNTYVGGTGTNGVHANGAMLTVSGAETILNILYNDSARNVTPAVIEANGVTVNDGATLYVGKTESSTYYWPLGIWFGNGGTMTVSDGADVTFDTRDGKVFNNNGTVTVTGDNTNFTVITTEEYFQGSGDDVTITGTVTWLTPEQADAGGTADPSEEQAA